MNSVYGVSLVCLFVVLEAPDPALSMLVVSGIGYPLVILTAIARVRGLGLLVAAELRDRPSRDAVAAALDAGLVVNAVTESALRLAPSLLVTDDEVDEAVSILTAVLA